MSRRRKILLGSLIGALADYRTRVNADGGVVEALTCANSLDADVVMIPSGYKATKLYSQIGTDGVDDFDVARNSVATRVNKLGLIEEVAIDVPRLDYSDSNCPSLLLEPQSTNLLAYSEDFSDASWIKTNTTIIDNSVLSPRGDIDASLFADDSTNDQHRLYYGVPTSLGSYTFSCFAKAGTGLWLKLMCYNGVSNIHGNFDLLNGTVGLKTGVTSNIEDYGNGWYKCSISADLLGSASSNFQIATMQNDEGGFPVIYSGSSDTWEIWGAQLEALPYPTSYIPTVGSTVTRIADSVTGAGDANSFNSEEGVLFVEMAALADDLIGRFIDLSDGISYANGSVELFYYSSSNRIRYSYRTSGSVVQSDLIYLSEDITQYLKIACVWKINRFELWVNGVKRVEDTSGIVNTANLFTDLSFSRINLGAKDNIYGKVKALKVFTTALSDAQLETLTT